MSRHYDGPRGDNGGGALLRASGWVAAAVLYVPALGVVAVAGAVAETASRGSTSKWDAERIFDRR